jgi:hypothetical protein
MIEKYESRRIRVQIRQVFLEIWDPIGVGNDPDAQDEYDGYIGRIYELLVSKSSDAELIDYLYCAQHDHMGLNADRSDLASTVEALRRIQLPVDSH